MNPIDMQIAFEPIGSSRKPRTGQSLTFGDCAHSGGRCRG